MLTHSFNAMARPGTHRAAVDREERTFKGTAAQGGHQSSDDFAGWGACDRHPYVGLLFAQRLAPARRWSSQ